MATSSSAATAGEARVATSSSAATAGDVDEEGMQVKDAGSVKNMAKELERIRRATRPKTPVEVHADSWSQGTVSYTHLTLPTIA